MFGDEITTFLPDFVKVRKIHRQGFHAVELDRLF